MSNMIKARFDSTAQADLFSCRWEPEQAVRAVVLIVHGMGEHCLRYQALAEVLTASGIAVCSLDLPGHGQSAGTPGFVPHFSDFTDTVLEYREQIGQWYPQKQVFLLGHSMGGLISSCVLLQNQSLFAGCILSGPAIQSPLQPSGLQMLMIKLLSALAPKAGALQLDASGVSRDPAVVQDYSNDPLVHHGKVSARLVKELFAGMNAVKEQAASISIPMLLLHGEADSMTAAAGSQFLHDTISSSDKTLTIYPDLYHEIFNEPEGPQIHATVCAWVEQRIQSA